MSRNTNQRVASLLNEILLLPTLSLVSRSCLLNRCRCDLEKSTAPFLMCHRLLRLAFPTQVLYEQPPQGILPPL